MNQNSIAQLTRDDLKRLRRLRNNALDLSIALDDVDQELAPLLERRARLATLLADAQAELRELLADAQAELRELLVAV